MSDMSSSWYNVCICRSLMLGGWSVFKYDVGEIDGAK